MVVTFDAGYSTIPSDVFSATVDVVKMMLYARNRDPNLRSENIEQVYQAAYFFGAGPNSDGGLPESITGPIERYRMPVIA